jgi:hypothetical protein
VGGVIIGGPGGGLTNGTIFGKIKTEGEGYGLLFCFIGLVKNKKYPNIMPVINAKNIINFAKFSGI